MSLWISIIIHRIPILPFPDQIAIKIAVSPQNSAKPLAWGGEQIYVGIPAAKMLATIARI
jgi:hypothetical protein